MKDLFSIHYSFVILILLMLLMGYINLVLMFMFIILFHELGHIIMIKLFGYKINKVVIYATGGVISTNIAINIKSYKLFLISISGIVMQLLLFLLPIYYFQDSYLFKELNMSLILFNILPIYPSDGYKMVLSILEHFASYSYIIKFSYLFSLITLFIIFFYCKNIIIFISLYILNIQYILEYHYYLEKFFLERHLYGVEYKKKKIVNNLTNIYKCRNNYIKYDNMLKEEKEYLSEKYAYFIDI